MMESFCVKIYACILALMHKIFAFPFGTAFAASGFCRQTAYPWTNYSHTENPQAVRPGRVDGYQTHPNRQ